MHPRYLIPLFLLVGTAAAAAVAEMPSVARIRAMLLHTCVVDPWCEKTWRFDMGIADVFADGAAVANGTLDHYAMPTASPPWFEQTLADALSRLAFYPNEIALEPSSLISAMWATRLSPAGHGSRGFRCDNPAEVAEYINIDELVCVCPLHRTCDGPIAAPQGNGVADMDTEWDTIYMKRFDGALLFGATTDAGTPAAFIFLMVAMAIVALLAYLTVAFQLYSCCK